MRWWRRERRGEPAGIALRLGGAGRRRRHGVGLEGVGEGEEGVEEGGGVDVRAWPDAGGREDSSSMKKKKKRYDVFFYLNGVKKKGKKNTREFLVNLMGGLDL